MEDKLNKQAIDEAIERVNALLHERGLHDIKVKGIAFMENVTEATTMETIAAQEQQCGWIKINGEEVWYCKPA